MKYDRMRPTVYLETTIHSYLAALPSRDIVVAAHQQITHQWWAAQREEYGLCISQFVLDEAGGGDVEAAEGRLALLAGLPLLDVNEETRELALALIRDHLIPRKKAADAAHLSVAAVHGIDFLLTWNCEHLANAGMQVALRRICEREGFSCPVICTPEQLIGG